MTAENLADPKTSASLAETRSDDWSAEVPADLAGCLDEYNCERGLIDAAYWTAPPCLCDDDLCHAMTTPDSALVMQRLMQINQRLTQHQIEAADEA